MTSSVGVVNVGESPDTRRAGARGPGSRPGVGSALLTARQAAARLGVSDKLVYRMFHAGKLRGVKVEGAVRIYTAAVEDYIRAHTNRPPEAPAAPPPPDERGRKGGDDFTAYYLKVMDEVAQKRPAG
jgi:excisionase family DNA binding protein